MGNSFVLFDVSIVISHGQFHCGNRGHTQNADFPWVKSHFPVGKRSSGTTAIDEIVVKFLEDPNKKLLEADACFNTISLPLAHQTYEDFKKCCLTSLIYGGKGYGRF